MGIQGPQGPRGFQGFGSQWLYRRSGGANTNRRATLNNVGTISLTAAAQGFTAFYLFGTVDIMGDFIAGIYGALSVNTNPRVSPRTNVQVAGSLASEDVWLGMQISRNTAGTTLYFTPVGAGYGSHALQINGVLAVPAS